MDPNTAPIHRSPIPGGWWLKETDLRALTGPMVAFAFVTIACVYRLLSFRVAVFDWDEYAFALVARDVLHGKLPNAGVFDNKPVGLTYLFALAEWLGGQTPIVIRALGLTASTGCGVLLYGGSRRLGLSRAGAAMIGSLFLLESLCLGAFATMSELLSCSFIAAGDSLLISSRRNPLALLGVGLAYGISCQISYLAIPCVALTVLGRAMVDPGRSLRARVSDLSLLVLGGVAGVSVLWAPQLITGDWTGYVADQLRYHRGYRLTSFNWDDWIFGFAAPISVIALPILFILLLRLQRNAAIRPLSASVWMLGLQFVGAVLAAMASNRFYAHYLLLALPAALLTTAALLSGTAPERRQTPWLLLVAIGIFAATLSFVSLQRQLAKPGFEVQASALVDRLTRPDQSIVVFDETPIIYYLSQRATSGRYVFPTHYLSTCNGLPPVADAATVLAQGLTHRPALVLLGAMCPQQIDAEAQLRRAGYRTVEVIQSGDRRIAVEAPSPDLKAPR